MSLPAHFYPSGKTFAELYPAFVAHWMKCNLGCKNGEADHMRAFKRDLRFQCHNLDAEQSEQVEIDWWVKWNGMHGRDADWRPEVRSIVPSLKDGPGNTWGT